jgi:predicted ArsR family transcriptional regulator
LRTRAGSDPTRKGVDRSGRHRGVIALPQHTPLAADQEIQRSVQDHWPVLQWPGPAGQRPSVIAERAGISKQAVNQVLRDLERLGYVGASRRPARQPGPAGRADRARGRAGRGDVQRRDRCRTGTRVRAHARPANRAQEDTDRALAARRLRRVARCRHRRLLSRARPQPRGVALEVLSEEGAVAPRESLAGCRCVRRQVGDAGVEVVHHRPCRNGVQRGRLS